VPAGTPKEIVARLHAEAKKALADSGRSRQARRPGLRRRRQYAEAFLALRAPKSEKVGE